LSIKRRAKENLFLDNLMENNVVVIVELDLLASNIKREVYNVLDVFLSFLKKFDERKVHNIFALMLDLRYK
jgi:hypothetical protein